MELIDFFMLGDLVDSHGNIHYEDIKGLTRYHECSEQIKWERDVAIRQLQEMGGEFLAKNTGLTKVIWCEDCLNFQPIRHSYGMCRDTKRICFRHDYCSFSKEKKEYDKSRSNSTDG